ncbi:hypothetical protein ABT297_31355 [Dactylosporangium sp. NPDC000555]|uniref:hypothetical protein n=1 Tax=Dactylosporangium sp. NPDC000555 TaxID=3154260 RepID=UPI00332F16C3
MKKAIGALSAGLVAAAALAAPGAAHASPGATTAANLACSTTVDIGYTVFSGGYVRGSGSYTSESCLAISKVTLVITHNGSEVGATRVTRYPSTPSSASFSPTDYRCATSSLYSRFRTKITWTYVGGGGGTKLSNEINVECS